MCGPAPGLRNVGSVQGALARKAGDTRSHGCQNLGVKVRCLLFSGGTDEGTVQKTTEEQAKTQDSGEAPPPQPEGGSAEIAVKEEIDWDAQDDAAAITPPLIDDEAQHSGEWQDIPGPEGMRQPTTPELLVDLDDTSAQTSNPLQTTLWRGSGIRGPAQLLSQ